MANGDRTISGSIPPGPGARPCCTLQPDPIGSIAAIYDLTTGLDHHYSAGTLEYVSGSEISGFLYTCALGFVDLGHTRETTDYTWYYFNWLRRNGKNRTGDTITVLLDAGGTITLKKDVPISDHLLVARSIAYDQALFHEIWTYWVPQVGGHSSSFSPEDLVSNLVGTYIGERAIKALAVGNFGGNFDKAATAELVLFLMRVQALPKNKVVEAFSQIKDRWVSGSWLNLTYLQRRNFNVAPIAPWLVLTNEPACDPLLLPSDFQKDFPADTRAFYEIAFNVHPRLQAALGAAVVKTSDFASQIVRIKTDAVGRYGSDFDKP